MSGVEYIDLFQDVSVYNSYDRLKKAGLTNKEAK